jgi:hypothetical protein
VPFYVSAGDTDGSARKMYQRNKTGFRATRIPRKAKKRLLREWQRWQWGPNPRRAPKAWR